MEFVVNGTKGGFRTLYSTPSAPSIGSDIRNNVSSEDAVGKSLYALTFSVNGCAFTKYIIVRDTLRSYSTGTIAFSLFLASNKELANKGADVKSLLDRVSLNYSDNYIIDNNVNRGETTLIQEDWSFIDDIINDYRELDKITKEEELQSGSKDAAVIYYRDDVELIEYLNKPFQEEYSSYRQILFIDNDLRGKPIDPINILRNSGDEIKNIDLKNEKYYLNNYNRTKNVIITANGKPRSDGKGNNIIRAKWQVEIKYSKDDLCFWPIEAKGILSDLDSEIFKYLEIRERNIKIVYEAFNNPIPKTKNFLIKVKNQNGDPVTDTIITYKKNNYSQEKTATSDTITFIGEEIKECWFVSARKDSESLMSESIPIFPENHSEVELILRKQKVIKIFAIDKDSRDPIYNFKLLMNDGQGNRENITELIFKDTDIEKTWQIGISKNIGRDNYSGKIEYCPFNGENPLYVELQKTTYQFPQNKTYIINAGLFGKKSPFCPKYSNSSNGNDLADNCIIPNKGYFFTYWELNDDNRTLIAQYDKKKSFLHNKLLLALLITGIILILLGLWVLIKNLYPNNIHQQGNLDSEQILNYINGDSLILNKLKVYQEDWSSRKPIISKKSEGIIGFFIGSASKTDSTSYIQWKECLDSIKSAITKRTLVDNKDFYSLIKLPYYSDLQQKFKKSIERIDSTEYIEIRNGLPNVSKYTLNQIADFINTIIAQIKKKNETKPDSMIIKQPAAISSGKITPPPNLKQELAVDKDKITQYLQGNELKKETLENFKSQALNPSLKKSIDLALKFWKLDGTKNNSYYSYRKEIKNDNILKNSYLRDLISSMSDDDIYVITLPQQDQNKKLIQIKEKLK